MLCTDVLIREAMDIRIRHVMGGGVVLTHPNGDSEEGGDNTKVHDHEFQSQMWSEWVPDSHFWNVAVGFVATLFIPDEKHEFRVHVLDLTTITVQHRLNRFGRHEFRYLERVDSGDPLGLHRAKNAPGNNKDAIPAGFREIPGVITVYMEPPDAMGNIRGIASRLVRDLEREEHLWACAMAADEGRAQPYLITQEPNKINLNESKTVDVSGTANQYNKSNYLGYGTAVHPADKPTGQIQSVPDNASRAIVRHLNGSRNLLSWEQRQFADEDAKRAAAMAMAAESSIPQIDLVPGRVVGTQQLPEPPSISPIDFRHVRRERVLLAFGIPASMVDGSTAGKSDGGSKGSSSSSSSSSSKSQSSSGSSNVQMMFLSSQRALQEQLCRFMQTLYSAFYFNGNAKRYILSEVKKRKRKRNDDEEEEEEQKEEEKQEGEEEEEQTFDIDSVTEKLQVKVTLPFLPDPSVLWQLWETGWLKDEALRKYISREYHIPLEDLNEKAKPPMMANEKELMAEEARLNPKPTPSSSSTSSNKKQKK